MSRTISVKLPGFSVVNRRVAAIVLAIALLAVAYFWHDIYLFARYRDQGEREAQALAYQLSDTILLPTEIPGLATITDVKKVNRGGVLSAAKNGDKILLYYQSGRAILYRPDIAKVVAIGPIVLDASAVQVKDSKIVLRNGSGNEEKLRSTLGLLNESYSEADIDDPAPASRSDFPKTIVVDLTEGKKTEFVGAIIELLGAQKGILPQGESKPDADILIIVGKDEES